MESPRMMPPSPVPATALMSVKLEAQQWNSVLGALGEVPMPYRITAPLIASITEQLHFQTGEIAAAQSPPAEPPPPNGHDREESQHGSV